MVVLHEMAKPPTAKFLSVDDFMAALTHPLKQEAQAIREIILAAHKGIGEQIKWGNPTFDYRGYIVTFNFYRTDTLRLVFHNGAILDQSSGIFEGDYPDRRLVSIRDMADVRAKKLALCTALQQWARLMDGDS